MLTNADWLLMEATFAEKMGRRDEAEEWFQKALSSEDARFQRKADELAALLA